jgi:hypothetical protein
METSSRRVAVLDGTAPHRRSADLPGVKDELINLGEFWDAAVLSNKKEEILTLAKRKGEAYTKAYRYLAIAGEASVLLKATLEQCIYHEKMVGAVDREIKKLQRSNKMESSTRYISAFGMRGYERLSLPTEAKTVVSVSDEYGSAMIYLSLFEKKMANTCGYIYRVFPSCFADSEIEGVLLPQNKMLFLKDAPLADRQINMRRFLNTKAIAHHRKDIRTAMKIRTQMIAEAENALHEVGEAHFALEKIYGDAMNFKEKEKYTNKVIDRVLSCLKG